MTLPAGFTTVNPFIICDDAAGAMRFITEVFDAVEAVEARTADPDGLLVHAELRVGDGTIMFCDRKPEWPYTPSLLQIYVPDVRAALERGVERGATIVTEPTDFYGGTFSRMRDPWGNGWWVWDAPAEEPSSGAGDQDEAQEWADDTAWEPTPEMSYINDTMHDMFRGLQDPREAR